MDLLFSSLAAYGHTFPLIPLARAAQRAGHRVHWATGDGMHRVLRDLGFATATAGTSITDAFEQLIAADESVSSTAEVKANTEGHRDLIDRAFGELIPRSFATDLAPILDRVRPDAVIAEAGNFGAVDAADAAGIPVVLHGIGRGFGFGRDVPATPLLDIFPASLQEPAVVHRPGRVPLRPTAFAPDGPLPAVVTDDSDLRPLVYVTLGTEFGDAAILAAAVTSIASLGVRVLLALGPSVSREALGVVPDAVHVADWVPQAAVLPHASAIVHHGGAGTTLAALAAGLPQLVLPQGADQFRNADAVVSGGLGRQLIGAQTTPLGIRSAVEELLDPAGPISRSSAAMVDEIEAMPSPDAVVAGLPDLVARRSDAASA